VLDVIISQLAPVLVFYLSIQFVHGMEEDTSNSRRSVVSVPHRLVDSQDFTVGYTFVGQIGLLFSWYLFSEGSITAKKMSTTPILVQKTLPFAQERRVIIDREGIKSVEPFVMRKKRQSKNQLEFQRYEDNFFSAGRDCSFKLPVACQEYCGQTLEDWNGKPGELLALFISLIPCVSSRPPRTIIPGEFSIHCSNPSIKEQGSWKQFGRFTYTIVNPLGWPKFFSFTCVLASWYLEDFTLCRRQWYFGEHRLGSFNLNTVVLEYYYSKRTMSRPTVVPEMIFRSTPSLDNAEVEDHIVSLIEKLKNRSGLIAIESLFAKLDDKLLLPPSVTRQRDHYRKRSFETYQSVDHEEEGDDTDIDSDHDESDRSSHNSEIDRAPINT